MYPFRDSFFESPYESRRRRAAEEARRRSEQERYYRMLAAQEQEEERQHQEYLRQQEARARMIRQRQEEREEQQRQAYEAARLRRERAEAEAAERRRAQQRYWKTKPFEEETDSESEEDPEYQVVRGYDGRLYRMRNPVFQKQLRTPRAPKNRLLEGPDSDLKLGRDGRLYRVRKESQNEKQAPSSPIKVSVEDMENVPKTRDIPITKTTVAMDVDSEDVRDAALTKKTLKNPKKDKKSKKKRKKITVIVEDASDSEYEDEFKSPLRNRLPSPGEWMEPVEYFQ